MGLILDLAVVALALMVIGSLALLAWTLGVSAVVATQRGHDRVTASRRSIADAQARLSESTARASAVLSELSARTTPRQPDRYGTRGEPPDA